MDRISRFHAYATHAWLGRIHRRLTVEEKHLAENFLNKNHSLNKNDFELAVNRMFLDLPKPKHWKEVLELLTCSNS